MEGPIHVLHVDDEPDLADLVADFLEREDDRLSVRTATNPSDGLSLLADGPVECVVSDYDMPERDGIEFLRTVREDHPDLPFILYTGKGSEEVASEAISAGVTDYLQKERGSEQYEILANRIGNAVSKRRAEELVGRAFNAMDKSREGIALLDESGEFVYVNRAYTDVVGYDQSELVGEFWEMVYPDEQAERISKDIIDAVPTEGHWSGDTIYQRKDGGRVRVNHALTYSDEGSMICLIRETSSAEAEQKALFEERQRFELLVDAVEDYAIFMLDTDGYVITWNTGAERIKGYAEDEILGTHFSNFYPAEQRDEGLPAQLLERALEEGSVEHQGPRVRADGTTFVAHVTISAVHDEDGTHRGFGKVTRDVSDRA